MCAVGLEVGWWLAAARPVLAGAAGGPAAIRPPGPGAAAAVAQGMGWQPHPEARRARSRGAPGAADVAAVSGTDGACTVRAAVSPAGKPFASQGP